MQVMQLSSKDPDLIVQGLMHNQTVCDGLGPARRWTVLFFDIMGFSRFEQSVGQEICTEVTETLYHIICQCAKGSFDAGQYSVIHVWDDGFAVLLADKEKAAMQTTAFSLSLQVEAELARVLKEHGYPSLRIRYGCSAPKEQDAEVSSVQKLAQQITEASRAARRVQASPPKVLVDEFHTVLGKRLINAVYQPIVNFARQTTIGWEGLARGPHGSLLQSPASLFQCADQLGRLYELEHLCRERAIAGAGLASGELLFINVSPHTLLDPEFREGETQLLLGAYALRPEQVVIEITEHQAVSDYVLFNRIIDHYRKQGYKVAIDDTGAGYSGLVTLTEVKPDFVKVDMQLIRDIHLNETKRSIVNAIQYVSEGFGAAVIAEGIECVEEYQVVRECGVAYGQGYLFGKPEAPRQYSNYWHGRRDQVVEMTCTSIG